MNSDIQKLYKIAGKEERTIVGLMSGTSLDGLDIALCRCAGNGLGTKIEVLEFVTIPYDSPFKNDVKSIFSKREIDLQKVCLLNALIGDKHGDLIMQALNGWNVKPEDVDLIASHGQTIYHAPKSLHGLPGYSNATLQIGDGDHIAVKTGIITISDFRQKHVAAGGEGAPLALYGDYLLFSKQGENRIMLNMGGISNFTFLPADLNNDNLFSTDVGPGNTLIDQYVQKHLGLAFDKNAELASTGVVNETLLDELLTFSFLSLPFPKTTGPELFNLGFLENAQNVTSNLEMKHEDVLATLCMFTSQVIANAVNNHLSDTQLSMYTSGGGMHNPLIMKNLKELLPAIRFFSTADLNINPDAKEAVLFALLANECVAGGNTRFGNPKRLPAVCMGKISLPH